MSGDALQTQARGRARHAPSVSQFLLFAAVMLGRPDEVSSSHVAAMAARATAAASSAVAQGRTAVDDERAHALRLIYLETRGRTVGKAQPASHPALRALASLPRRQRAAICLEGGLGAAPELVAAVLAVRPGEADSIRAAARGSFARGYEGPGDGLAALRRRVRHLVEPSRVIDVREEASKLPRPVVRRLLDPVSEPGSEPAIVARMPRASEDRPLDLDRVLEQMESEPADLGSPRLTARAVAGPFPSVPEPAVALTVPRTRPRRLIALVAAVITVASLIILPAGAGSPDPAPAVPPAVLSEAVSPAEGSPAVTAVAAVTPKPVTVRSGDTLWDVAETHLGDPLRWPEIWRLNRGTTMAGGERFRDPDLIRPGWALRLPSR